MPADTVLIVGGGISGLATAYYLGKAGIRSTIIEKTNRLGGLIKTDRIQGCDLEAGPESFIATKTAVAELAQELGGGLHDRIIGSNDQARRIFVVRDGKLTPMPRGMSMMVPGEWGPVLKSPLLSAATKFGLLRETFRRPFKRDEDFSVGELVSSHFGPEMLDYITEPLLAGVYGGDSSRLSARSVLPRFVGFEEQYGSLIKGVRRNSLKDGHQGSLFLSFQGGMQTLVDALAKAVQEYAAVIYEEATGLEPVDNGWRVRFRNESISSRRVVLACPAWTAAKLLAPVAESVSTELGAIPYSSAILAMLVFAKSTISHPLDGFGFLVPRQEQQTIAAATWINTKFPSRIANGLVALRGFVVGEKAETLMKHSQSSVLEAVRKDFARLMGVHGEPVFTTFYTWPKSMPQYVVGHQRRISGVQSEAQQFKGLFLAGNYFDGVGIPDSIRRAKQVSKQIAHEGV